MIFKLHYWFITSGLCAIGVLMGVFVKAYTDASTLEIGGLFMMMHLVQIFTKPIICSMADRDQAHREYLMVGLFIVALGYSPFVIIPYLGPGIYKAHPRFCWYFLAIVKIIGDIGLGGAVSLGDTLAINYAKRTSADYNKYRIYGTVSWMFFGLVIGQFNEIWFLPKYTAAFMLLIASSLLNMSIYWLWPDEYFRIVESDGPTKVEQQSKSLMSRDVVLAHIRGKIASLFCLAPKSEANLSTEMSCATPDRQHKPDRPARTQISKKTQLRILALLFKRDLRIILYLCFFILCGMACARLNFFFMSMGERCEREGSCQFSQMAGYLQVAMASMETFLLGYLKQINAAIGQVNTCTLLALTVAAKNLFYGTLWMHISPYYSLLVEPLQGIMIAFTMSTTIEMAHRFGSEVQYIIPELIERQIISKDDDLNVVKRSVRATMQAIVSSCLDGLGRGLGALFYGIIVDHYSYEDLWFGIGVVAIIVALICVAINIFDHIFQLKLGLDKVESLDNIKAKSGDNIA